MKCVTEIDDRVNLRALIIQDLKDLGIKLPKDVRKNKWKEEDSVVGDQTSVFGNKLCNVPCAYLEGYGQVPQFLVEATRIIEDGIGTEGLFRKSGSVARQKEIRQLIEDGGDLTGAPVQDVSCLIKQFFRELPDPLLTSKLHDTFLKCYQLENEADRISTILLLCLLLPGEHLNTLRFMMSFLSRVAANSEENKMDTANLAVCLAPNMLNVNSKQDKMNVTESKLLQNQTSIIQLLITHAEDIGFISESLHDRTSMMSSCFLSEDEWERSSEIEDGKSKKKKKRSGSFQGIMNEMSNSFTKWRRRSGKGHNQSNVSEKSTMSLVVEPLDQSDACKENITQDATKLPDVTPKVMRKRKASCDLTLPFSASKKKAILQQMPQMSALANTPFTPASVTKSRVKDYNFTLDSPSIQFADDSSVVFTATTPSVNSGMPKKKPAKLFFSPGSAKAKRVSDKSLNSSTKTTPKPKRRSMKGLLRRLSGSKDAQSSPASGILDSSDAAYRLASLQSLPDHVTIVQPTEGQKKKGLFGRRHKKTPSSPARLITPPLSAEEMNALVQAASKGTSVSASQMESSSLADCSSMIGDSTTDISCCAGISRSESDISDCMSISNQELAQKLRNDLQIMSPASMESKEDRSASVLSADVSLGSTQLRRGKPNTIKVGLPQERYTPSKEIRQRRSMDRPAPPDAINPVDISMHIDAESSMSCHLDVTMGTTANMSILPSQSMHEGACDQSMQVESIHDQAFFEEGLDKSIMDETSPMETECTETDDTVFKKPLTVNVLKTIENHDGEDNEKLNTSTGSDASDSSIITVIHNGVPVLKKKSSSSSTSTIGDSIFKERAPVVTNPCEEKERDKCQELTLAGCEGTCRHWISDYDGDQNIVSQQQDLRNTSNLANGDPAGETPQQALSTFTNNESKCALPSCENSKVNSVIHLDRCGDTKVCRHFSYNCLHAAREPVPLQKKVKKRRHSAEPKLQISSEMHHMLERAGVMGMGNRKHFATTPFEAVNILSEVPATEDPKHQVCNLIDEATVGKLDVGEKKGIAISEELQRSVRQSVLDLKETNAGKVASKVERFNTVMEVAVETELAERQASPFRFPNSALRTKGRSPVRVPTVFAKNDERGNKLRELAMSVAQHKTVQTAKRPIKAKANLPISTSLVRPKVVEKALTKIASAGDVVHPKVNRSEDKLRRRSAEPMQHVTGHCSINLSSDKELVQSVESVSGMPGSPVHNQHDPEKDNIHLQTPEPQGMLGPPPGSTPVRLVSPIVTPVQINESLLETIDEVCTPMSEKVRRRSDKICRSSEPLQDSNQANVRVDSPQKDESVATKALKLINTPQATPKILPPMVFCSVTKSILDRNGTGLNTPRTAFTPKVREVNRQRGPVKPVKRLGSPSSPRSPKSPKKYHTSPKRYTKTKGKLSPIPSHVIDWDV